MNSKESMHLKLWKLDNKSRYLKVLEETNKDCVTLKKEDQGKSNTIITLNKVWVNQSILRKILF